MKPPEDVTRKVLTEWLRKADTDLAVADQLLSQEVLFPIAVSFHAQQAAEKYLKAFLTGHQVAFPKTHDLEKLLDLVATINDNLASSLRDVIVLTLYGVEMRYPGDSPEPTPAQAKESLQLAQSVRDAIRTALQGML